MRDRYGRGQFRPGLPDGPAAGRGGRPFVEVVMGDGVGWDTHRDNFPRTRALSLEADAGMAALVEDLHERGLLDSTLVVWMGEFGRTPQITSGGGRNHWARAWSSVLVGGGIAAARSIGRTDRDAAEVVDRPISVTDFLATVCTILGIDYTRQNRRPGVERPIPIVDVSKPVTLISNFSSAPTARTMPSPVKKLASGCNKIGSWRIIDVQCAADGARWPCVVFIRMAERSLLMKSANH